MKTFLTYNQFRSAVRAWYGIPVAPEFMARLWKAYQAGNVTDYPALNHLLNA